MLSPKDDARGEFAKSQGDRKSDGVASVTPTAITGYEDATMQNADKKPSPNPRFDTRAQTNNRG